MKKKFLAIICAALITATVGTSVILSGCGSASASSSATSDTAQETSGAIAGGWTVNTEAADTNIPKELLEVFNKATESYTGVGLEPVAYLGSQVVAGANYAFLCNATTVTANPTTELDVVIVYQDTDGNAEITKVTPLDVSKYVTDSEVKAEETTGGWTAVEAAGQKTLPEDVQKALTTATEGLSGVGYEPLASLGSQVVAGVNYAVLCKSTTVTENPLSALAVVTVHADLNGGAEVLSVANFDIADFT